MFSCWSSMVPLHESMLATPNHLVWKWFLIDWSEAEWLVFPWILLLEDWGDICFLPGLRNLIHQHNLHKWWGENWQWHGTAPSAPPGCTHQVPGTCVCPGCLDVPLSGPSPTMLSLPCSRLFLRSQGPGIPINKAYQWRSRWRRLWEPHCLPRVLSAGLCAIFATDSHVPWSFSPCSVVCRHPFCGHSDPWSWLALAVPNPVSAHLDSVYIHLRSPAPASMPHTSVMLE